MKKSADAFRSIGEVAKMIGVAPHVLRYWETQFSQLNPMKRPDGRRYYRPDDVHLAAGLCEIMREDGLTIRGAKKLISRDRGETVRARGLARLNGEEQDNMPKSDGKSAVTPQKVTRAEPQHASPEPIPALAKTEEPNCMVKSDKSKPRKTRAPDTLPLFPDLTTAPDKRHAAWLSHLVNTAIRLRRTAQLDNAARRQCGILRDAITRHY